MKLFYQEAIISGEFIAAISSFIAYVYTGKQVTLFKKIDVFYSQNLRREKICRIPLQRSTSTCFLFYKKHAYKKHEAEIWVNQKYYIPKYGS